MLINIILSKYIFFVAPEFPVAQPSCSMIGGDLSDDGCSRWHFVTSILIYSLVLAGGALIGYLAHYLHSHSSRSCFESDERRKVFSENIPVPDGIEVNRLLCRQ